MNKLILLIPPLLGLYGLSGDAMATGMSREEMMATYRANEPAAGALWTEPGTGMEFVWAPSGCFQMGGDGSDPREQPVHEVCVRGFWMGRYEVTQGQYQKITKKLPGHFSGADKPVANVSWNDANDFAQQMSHSTGAQIRLPSEAEWEYACRAGGAHEIYCGPGGDPARLAWYDGNSGNEAHAVGQRVPNNWGLYDMSGNLWEWTQDCWNDSYATGTADGSAREFGNCGKRVIRGGSWGFSQGYLHAAKRVSSDAGARGIDTGFRVTITRP
jgi:formylglycine-generating enzyme required for sulfatase activity